MRAAAVNQSHKVGESPPHSIEAEQAVLGCCLIAPDDCIPETFKILREETCFYDLRNQTVFRTLLWLHDRREAIVLITLSQRLRDIGELEAAGGRAYVASLPDMVASSAMLNTYLKTVVEKYKLRRVIQHHSDGLARAHSANGDAAELLASIPEKNRSLELLLAGGDSSELLRLLDRRQFNEANRPEPVVPRFTLAGKPLATPGNLATILAQAKAGKSAFVAAMIAAGITLDPENFDTFRIGSLNPEKRTLLHFDTEQSVEDHDRLVRNALRRAGTNAPPSLKSYLLTGQPPQRCRAAVRAALEREREYGRKIHSVIIDGVADLVNDVNVPAECNALVAELHGLAIEFDCAIVVVIHLNPKSGQGGFDKHLGSQLERKSETNLKLEKANGITTVSSDKQRGAPITTEDGVRFKWDDEAGMHMSCEEGAPTLKPEKMAQYQAEIAAAFEDRAGMKFGELLTALQGKAKLSKSTANHRITRDYPKAGLIASAAGIYSPKK